MSTSINSNIPALVAQSNLRLAGAGASRSIAALSSGKRIIRAADDVSGLSIGTVLRTNVSTLKTALGNTRQANSLLQIADGGLSSIGEILQRQASLATQAKSGSLSDTERGFLNQEFTALTAEIDRLVSSTKFNQVVLLDGSLNDANAVVSDTRTGDTDADGNAASTDTGDALGVNRTVTTAAPNFGDTIVTSLDLSNGAANGGIFNNADFIGKLDSIDVTYTAANTVLVEFRVGDITYTGTLTTTAGGTVSFDGVSDVTNAAAGGSFDVVFGTQTAAVTSQSLADDFGDRIRAAFSTVTIFQNRIVSSFRDDITGTIYDSSGTTTIGDLQGATVQLQLEDFSDVNVESVLVKAPTGGGTQGTIEVVINGEIYRNNTIAGGTVGAGATLTLTSTANQDHTLIFTNGAAAALDFSSEENATYVQAALEKAFGVKQGGSALQFQIGSTSNEIIRVAIKNASTNSLFDGQSLSVNTADNAAAALTQINIAISTVTSLRADVGALQSRFDYAAASIETAIQNQDAARGLFLDADVADESTKFSNAQVLLQASISVLAQANQLPQNLLKLIG